MYCMQSRTRVVLDLHGLNDWEDYMDKSENDSFTKQKTSELLLNHKLGVLLQHGTSREVRDFRNRCRAFVGHLVTVTLWCHLVLSDLLQNALFLS